MSPLDFFFSLGDKVTKGDPRRQQDFTYYMIWILFLAFLWLFLYNAYDLFFNKNLNAATWTLVGFAICSLQFFTLKGLFEQKRLRKNAPSKPHVPEKVESVEEMMNGFKQSTKSKGGKK